MAAPTLMMSAADGSYTSALASQVNRQNALMDNKYVPNKALISSREDDADDLDMAKNAGIPGNLVMPIITTNPLRYISASDTTWHPFHNLDASKNDIYESFLATTNDEAPYEGRENDLNILRRVVKQAPIMAAYNQLFGCVMFMIIGIIIIIYFTATDAIHWGWSVAFGCLSVLSVSTAMYRIYFSAPYAGLAKWRAIKTDVQRETANGGSARAISNRLAGLKDNGDPMQSVQPVQQQSLGNAAAAGAMAGVANAAAGAFAGLFTK